MPIGQWSTTPANNATAATAINWAEGQPPSSVNDSARQMMADVAAWYQAPEWLNYALTPTYISGTQFSVTGNQTGIYTVGRRIRAFVTAGTIYGTIISSAFASVTTVGVTWDSGALDSGVSEVDVGILNSSGASLGSLPGLTLNEPGNSPSTLLINAPNDSLGANIKMIGSGASTPSKRICVVTGNFTVINDAGNSYLLTLTDSGNATFSGSITASSDERLKSKWKKFGKDFIDRLSKVKSGSFERKKTRERQVGVGAQSLRDLVPELAAAVLTDGKGYLSVAYGQAALVACVELAKEVVRLRAIVEDKK